MTLHEGCGKLCNLHFIFNIILFFTLSLLSLSKLNMEFIYFDQPRPPESHKDHHFSVLQLASEPRCVILMILLWFDHVFKLFLKYFLRSGNFFSLSLFINSFLNNIYVSIWSKQSCFICLLCPFKVPILQLDVSFSSYFLHHTVNSGQTHISTWSLIWSTVGQY